MSFTLPALGAVIWQVLAEETDKQTEALSSKSHKPLMAAYVTDQQWAVLAPIFQSGHDRNMISETL